MMGPGAQQPQQGMQQRGSGFSMGSQGAGGANPGMGIHPQMQHQQQNQFMMTQGMHGHNMNIMGGNPQQMQPGGVTYVGQVGGGMQGGLSNMNQGMSMQGGMSNSNQGMGMQGGMNNMSQGMGMQGSINLGMSQGMQGGMGAHQQWR
jgi:hypothetical protein